MAQVKMSPVAKQWLQDLVGLSEKVSPEALKEIRQAAQDKIWQTGLPTRKDENWQYTSIIPMLKQSFAPATPCKVESIEAFLPPFDVLPIVIVDGVYQPQFTQAFSKGTEVIWQQAEMPATESELVFEVLNDLMLTHSLKIKQAKHTWSDLPIFVLHLQTQPNQLSNLRTVIELEEMAELTVIERHVSLNEDAAWVNAVSDIQLAKEAKFKQVIYQTLNSQSFYFANQRIQQVENSNFETLAVLLGGQIARHQNRLHMLGEHCESHQHSIAFGEGSQTIDSRTETYHDVPNCDSNQLHKFVLKDKAKGVFDGMIYVARDAQKTDGLMDNRNLILSKDASMNTKPKLEIYADDVKCSHGCASGQMDDNQVFYMQARGIRKEAAYKLITQAFLLEPLEEISNEQVQHWLSGELTEKLHSL